ncbi:MAG TPA: AI-2E family transporter, partial [Candidatus Limnocylindrales bacterium]|nr:AI-2E family transporter [Candidatus Limnocylindrales bacterium]
VGVPPPASPGLVGPAMAASIVGEPRRDRRPFGWLILAALVVLWIARDVLGPFVVAAVAAYAFSPLIVRAQRRTGWSRGVIVAIGYALLLVVLGLLVYFLAGRVGHEIGLLAASGPDSLATLLRQLLGTDQLQVAGQTITVVDLAREIQTRLLGVVASPGDAVHAAGEVGSIGLELILALIVTFYFLVDGPMLRDRTIALLPQAHRARTVEVLDRIHDVLGRWLRGQLALIALIATVVYVGLGPILHLPYALGIAIVTGVLEIIPLIGPLIATAIAGTDAFARGGVQLALAVVAFYFVLRQVEDQIVMPLVIGRVVHLHPVITIFAVLVGLNVYGVLGGLLGVPVAAAVNVVFREVYPAAPPGGIPVEHGPPEADRAV